MSIFLNDWYINATIRFDGAEAAYDALKDIIFSAFHNEAAEWVDLTADLDHLESISEDFDCRFCDVINRSCKTLYGQLGKLDPSRPCIATIMFSPDGTGDTIEMILDYRVYDNMSRIEKVAQDIVKLGITNSFEIESQIDISETAGELQDVRIRYDGSQLVMTKTPWYVPDHASRYESREDFLEYYIEEIPWSDEEFEEMRKNDATFYWVEPQHSNTNHEEICSELYIKEEKLIPLD